MTRDIRNARIYCPTKTAMQSGRGKMKEWILEFEQKAKSRSVDYLMGWTGSDDMMQEYKLVFSTCEAAIAYAEKYDIPYRVIAPKQRKLQIRSYADNFTKPIINPLPIN